MKISKMPNTYLQETSKRYGCGGTSGAGTGYGQGYGDGHACFSNGNRYGEGQGYGACSGHMAAAGHNNLDLKKHETNYSNY